MPKKRIGDYERADDYLSEHELDIEFEYGKPYNELEPEQQTQCILDIFFKGVEDYRESAEELRDGINFSRATGEFHVKVDTITRRGREYTV